MAGSSSGGRGRASGGARGSGQAKTKTTRTSTTETIKAPGETPITFRQGGLRESLGVPKGQRIPAAKMRAALARQYGPTAAAQARFAKNVLTGSKSGGARKTTTTRTRGASRGSKAR